MAPPEKCAGKLLTRSVGPAPFQRRPPFEGLVAKAVACAGSNSLPQSRKLPRFPRVEQRRRSASAPLAHFGGYRTLSPKVPLFCVVWYFQRLLSVRALGITCARLKRFPAFVRLRSGIPSGCRSIQGAAQIRFRSGVLSPYSANDMNPRRNCDPEEGFSQNPEMVGLHFLQKANYLAILVMVVGFFFFP